MWLMIFWVFSGWQAVRRGEQSAVRCGAVEDVFEEEKDYRIEVMIGLRALCCRQSSFLINILNACSAKPRHEAAIDDT